jgi:hypothetical protein
MIAFDCRHLREAVPVEITHGDDPQVEIAERGIGVAPERRRAGLVLTHRGADEAREHLPRHTLRERPEPDVVNGSGRGLERGRKAPLGVRSAEVAPGGGVEFDAGSAG